MSKVLGILETALYVADMERSIEFYRKIFEFKVLSSGQRLTAMRIAENQVLLLFKKGASAKATETQYGTVPPTDGNGTLHLAFSISKNQIQNWIENLKESEIQIESQLNWPAGGTSVYFRDPDNHILELKTTDWDSSLEFESE